MTVRPRYTYRAKARDLRAVAKAATRMTGVLGSAVAPPARSLVAAISTATARIITSRYTDPTEPR
ncbi:MAG: hypothetical protein ACTH6A_06620 [Brachybacterium tyrofermentans]|uniref:hypothetical protein n=1 Tax=Brachybacterium tyrofermentans TaxID=47848 RepID=UPI003F8F70B9